MSAAVSRKRGGSKQQQGGKCWLWKRRALQTPLMEIESEIESGARASHGLTNSSS